MKKYFIKSVVVFLLTAVFFMAGGFCFNGLLGSATETNVARAASLDNEINSNTDSCGNNQTGEQTMPMQTTNHHNSILPCCSDSGHPTLNIFSKPFEIIKFISILFFDENQISKTVSKTVTHYTKIIPPPELVFLKSTILRI